MDDFVKHAPSYQLDQDILDARGINMTVEEVAGLSTGKYSQRVQGLNLGENDLVFLKCLRRRIKNRVASQNSRRRSVEHLRRLTRELRVVRACRHDALCDRRSLLRTNAELRSRYAILRSHIVQVLKSRSDPTTVPDLEIGRLKESHSKNKIRELPADPEVVLTKNGKNDNLFECRIEKLVQQSVNHIFKDKSEKKIVSAKTVFLDSKTLANVKKSNLDIQIEYDSNLECPLTDYQKLDSPKTVYIDTKKLTAVKKPDLDIQIEYDTNLKCHLTDHQKVDSPKTVYRDAKKLNSVKKSGLDIQLEYDSNISDYQKLDFDKTKASAKLPEFSDPLSNLDGKNFEEGGVLNLCVKERRRSHGRKQLAPKRITYVFTDNDDGVIDFSIKKENH